MVDSVQYECSIGWFFDPSGALTRRPRDEALFSSEHDLPMTTADRLHSEENQ
jgi:hypothetical protein